MTNLPNFHAGDVILVRFPFTDLTTKKVRPALVIVKPFDDDIFIAPITSNTKRDLNDIILNDTDFAHDQLPIPSCVRYHKLFTLHKKFVIRKFSKLTTQKFWDIRNLIIAYIHGPN